MNENQHERYLLSSVKNAMRILRLFKVNQNELGVTEIANKTGLSKSTTHRLISTLTKENFLSKNPKNNRYRLGLSLLTLGGIISVQKEIYKEALPIVRTLVDTLKETAHLCLLEKSEVVYLYRVECEQHIPLVTHIGRRNPIHCTSEGLAILAYQHDERIEHILQGELFAYTSKTITDPKRLKQFMRQIKEDGYVISKDHYFEGFIGIAAPIRDYTTEVVSSLSVIGPTTRITEERYPYFIDKITKAAAEISELLGFFGQDE